jgi:hypothetical protein
LPIEMLQYPMDLRNHTFRKEHCIIDPLFASETGKQTDEKDERDVHPERSLKDPLEPQVLGTRIWNEKQLSEYVRSSYRLERACPARTPLYSLCLVSVKETRNWGKQRGTRTKLEIRQRW